MPGRGAQLGREAGRAGRRRALTPSARGSAGSDRLSGRGYHRIRRVARTIADLDGDSELVDDGHVAVASELGEGTTVTITLPATTHEPPTTHTEERHG